MAGFKRLSVGLAIFGVYWLSALWLLMKVSPISIDGSGPVVTFYWGSHPPTPTLAEYDRSVGARLPFLYPYWLAASIITFMGCGLTGWLVRLWKPRRSRVFPLSFTTTLVSLLLVGAISDVGISRHIWWGPTMYGGLPYLWQFLKVLLPMSFLAAILAHVRNRLNHG